MLNQAISPGQNCLNICRSYLVFYTHDFLTVKFDFIMTAACPRNRNGSGILHPAEYIFLARVSIRRPHRGDETDNVFCTDMNKDVRFSF